MGEAPLWFLGMFGGVDAWLRDVSRRMRRALRVVRLLVFLMVVLNLCILAAGVLVVLRPEYVQYVVAFLLLVLLVPMVALTVLVSLPLRMKGVTRLIDKGYPANAKELALRALARKFRDRSIETEELLAEALWNEARKALRFRGARQERAERAERAAAAATAATAATAAARAADAAAMADAERDAARKRRDGP